MVIFSFGLGVGANTATFSFLNQIVLRSLPVQSPEELVPSYVFLASDHASYMTGQVRHPNRGEVVNG